MMLALVFSRDRALQLQATLESFMLQVTDAATSRVVVLYRATSSRHQSQYRVLAGQWAASIHFVEETAFQRQVIELLEPAGEPNAVSEVTAKTTHGDYCLLLVDDCIFVRSFRLEDVVQALGLNPRALGFSLRLGSNTTYCYSLNRAQAVPAFREISANVRRFHWVGAEGDFGYPLEVSSSIYRLKMLRHLLGNLRFENPSTLESQMALQARSLAARFPELICFDRSVAFCVPLNRVQDVYRNRASTYERYSVETLADLFDLGKRIDVRGLSGFTPSACHQEINLQFERR